MEHYTLTTMPQGLKVDAYEDQILLKVLRDAGLHADAPCAVRSPVDGMCEYVAAVLH